MGLFHCPVGAPFYGDDDCIECGMCLAKTKEEMVEASKTIRAYLQSRNENKSAIGKIAVTGKGGVGKSSVVILLANALGRRGYRVLVLDTDESNPGPYRMLGFDQVPKPLLSLLSRFSPDEPDASAEWLARERIAIRDIPSEYVLSRNGLALAMAGKIVDPFQGCACAMADIARDLVAKLVLDDNELLLVDTEAGTESFGRGVERNVDTLLIVVEPSHESLALAEKMGYMAQGMGITRVRAILNKVASDSARQRMMEELAKRKVEPIGVIHFDPQFSEAGFEGRPPGDSRATADMDEIADRLLQPGAN